MPNEKTTSTAAHGTSSSSQLMSGIIKTIKSGYAIIWLQQKRMNVIALLREADRDALRLRKKFFEGAIVQIVAYDTNSNKVKGLQCVLLKETEPLYELEGTLIDLSENSATIRDHKGREYISLFTLAEQQHLAALTEDVRARMLNHPINYYLKEVSCGDQDLQIQAKIEGLNVPDAALRFDLHAKPILSQPLIESGSGSAVTALSIMRMPAVLPTIVPMLDLTPVLKQVDLVDMQAPQPLSISCNKRQSSFNPAVAAAIKVADLRKKNKAVRKPISRTWSLPITKTHTATTSFANVEVESKKLNLAPSAELPLLKTLAEQHAETSKVSLSTKPLMRARGEEAMLDAKSPPLVARPAATILGNTVKAALTPGQWLITLSPNGPNSQDLVRTTSRWEMIRLIAEFVHLERNNSRLSVNEQKLLKSFSKQLLLSIKPIETLSTLIQIANKYLHKPRAAQPFCFCFFSRVTQASKIDGLCLALKNMTAAEIGAEEIKTIKQVVQPDTPTVQLSQISTPANRSR